MTAIFVPIPFIRVGSSTLIHVRDTVFGKVSAGATVSIAMPTNGAADVVVCMLGNDAAGVSPPSTPSGFTAIISEAFATDALAAYCVNPGASISYTNGNATRDMAYIFRSYSLVDTSSVLSGTATEASGTNGDPNPPSMTTSHNNAMVVACGICIDTNDTNYTGPSGYTELTVSPANDPDGDGQSCVVMMANKIVSTAGAENPAAFTNAAIGSADTHAFTFALKPA